jgi:hypothetical protein
MVVAATAVLLSVLVAPEQRLDVAPRHQRLLLAGHCPLQEE